MSMPEHHDTAVSDAPTYVVRSETNGRENNEDSFVVLSLVPRIGASSVTLLAVADGMGGHAYGEEVSREALRVVSLALTEQLMVESAINHVDASTLDLVRLRASLLGALQQASSRVRRLVEANKWGKAGSTIVVALVLGDQVVIGNLGDSPLFHYRAYARELMQVTEDHTVTGALLRASLISAEMARYHEGRNQLEFYVGVSELPREAPLHTLLLEPGDLLLLCSDGISGRLAHEEIRAILATAGEDLGPKADRLLQAAREAGESDNQTLILWRNQSAGAQAEPVLRRTMQKTVPVIIKPDEAGTSSSDVESVSPASVGESGIEEAPTSAIEHPLPGRAEEA